MATPGAGKPGAGKPGAGKPGAGKPGAGKPGAGKPGAGKPGAGKPGAGKPGAGKPGAGKPGAGKPGAGKPGAGKPGAGNELQQEARALADPTRHRIFRHIAGTQGPVGVAELTELLGCNHNAVRQHLAKLVTAGLVMEEVEERDRPGRPRLLYRVNPEFSGRWNTAGPYSWLAELLARALRRRRSPRDIGRSEGRALAAEARARERGRDPVDAIEAELALRGFRPARRAKGTRVEFVLGTCPFVDVASGDPGTVCKLHLGLAEGLAEGLGGVHVEQLAVSEARRAGCRLVLRRAERA